MEDKIGLGQRSCLIKALKEEKGLEVFNLSDNDMLYEQLEDITQGQKRLLHALMISKQTEKLIDVLDQFGIKRK